MVPTATMAANIEPQRAPKKPMVRTMAIPSPPRQWPTALVKTLTSRRAMPPSTITMPEKINSGMASNIYLLMESNVTWVSTLQGKLR